MEHQGLLILPLQLFALKPTLQSQHQRVGLKGSSISLTQSNNLPLCAYHQRYDHDMSLEISLEIPSTSLKG